MSAVTEGADTPSRRSPPVGEGTWPRRVRLLVGRARVVREEEGRQEGGRPRVSPHLLETRWTRAVDALEVIRKEGGGVQGRRGAGRADFGRNTSSPLLFQTEGVNSPGDEAWSCGN